MDVPQRVLDVTRRSTTQTILSRHTRLVLRYKPATVQDIEFINTLHENDHKKAGIYAKETYLPPTPSEAGSGDHNDLRSVMTPLSSEANNTAHKMVHNATAAATAAATTVKSALPPIHEWMATTFNTGLHDSSDKNGIDPLLEEAMKPSQEWINVGEDYDDVNESSTVSSTTTTATTTTTSSQGKVYFEVLACDDLPNMDLLYNKTDAFCCVILEDAIVNTSYIPNTLSPRWMPRGDNRAFCFHNVQHPSSDIFIGIFDHNPVYPAMVRNANIFRQRVHDPIGRVVINLTHLYPDTIYTLKYNIYEVGHDTSDDMMDRQQNKHNGTILVRLLIKWEHRMLAGMGLPPTEFWIAVPNKRDLQNAMYTTVGEVRIV